MRCIIVLLLLGISVVSQATEQVALIIGNSIYKHTPVLPNPQNDAADMAALLRNLQFKVTSLTDVDRNAFEDALATFGRQAAGADLALVFYAGHGIQVGGKNYLLPTDARLNDERDLRKLIPLDDVLYEASQASKLGVVIVDACRDNPLAQQLARGLGAQRSAAIGRGMSPIQRAPADVLVAFATEADATAADGTGRNSPYTTALKQHLATPGLELRLLFGRVRDSVMTVTHNQQRPYTYGSLGGEAFYLASRVERLPPASTPQRVRLAVKATPPNALVRIMNIVPAYRDGIELESGRYDIEVSAAGYETYREWHELTVGDQVLPITLASMVPPSPPADQTGKVIRDRLRDGSTGPEMVFIRGGRFQMGSPLGEEGRDDDERQHEVSVGDFYIGKYEVTVGEFRRFVTVTGYRTDAEKDTGNVDGCYTLDRDDKDKSWTWREWADWKTPNKYLANQDSHPVSCVSWNDAVAYIEWLNGETGQNYRLPTESEWEYAARAGTVVARYWGDNDAACEHANIADEKFWTPGFVCEDGYQYVAPVGQFKANAWGLHDMLGNVWEWTCSEYDSDYGGGESECASKNNASAQRVFRGGSWYTSPRWVRSAFRDRYTPALRDFYLGFRLARSK